MAMVFAVLLPCLALVPPATPKVTWHRAFYPPPCAVVEALERAPQETKEQTPTVSAPAARATGKPTQAAVPMWDAFDPRSTVGN